ncbi:HWE histidine kinase domain-containing protein [uncultured Algimonas sp.]|uniref:HWE histidine kinase domain-containing protein n=1 Tax=uncultured Algimonas sp. TaxID=1547920 RepID=UPI00260BE2B2|nr:HWE histidine kinase domain-containing protein [uncultured Algimonas sp.]
MAKAFLSQDEQLALDNCDAEPIHTPGQIQPFGCLLAGDLDMVRIDYASANTADVLGLPARTLLGTDFVELLGRQLVHDIRNMLSMSTAARQRERVGSMMRDGVRVELFAHRNPDKLAVIEFEPAEPPREDRRSPVERMRVLLDKASHQRTIQGLLKVCTHGLRDLTGYDRVKAYRYADNGDGEVVAESRAAKADSFLGLRYPAWDVPVQARALQIKNPVRILTDVAADPVPVLAVTDDLPPLDLGLAHLRGVSPIHIEYLKNMNVGATLTIGLVVAGRLWGMFACHHMSDKTIGSDLRIAVELFGQLISLVIQQKIEVERSSARAMAGQSRSRILAETDAATDLLHAFADLGPILQGVVESDGVAVIRDDRVQVLGSTPSSDLIRVIAARKPDEEDLIESTSSLVHGKWVGDADAGHSAGCMLIRCTAAYPLQLMFFRDGKTRKVNWAGKPEKTIVTGHFGARLHPRQSFAAYLEEQDGWSMDWSAFDKEAGRELQILLTQITAKGERAQMLRHKDLVNHQRQQDLMIAELNHRVKNILALIRSLSRQAKSSSASLESYAQALEQRIAALAAAHDLAVSNTMKGVSLRRILETELKPYASPDGAQYLLAGPRIGLRPDVAPIVALVFHEVVTNAAKYGALSTPDGLVRARWSLSDAGLAFNWQELGGPRVTEPERQGFGRSLIERAIPYEFDGTADLAYPEGGVTFDFTLPPDTLTEISEDETAPDGGVVGMIGKVEMAASDRRVLLVEDNLVLAMDMVESLTELGAEVVETCSTVKEAMRMLDRETFDFAVLDMNLRGVVSFDIARRLKTDGVPFLFVTGYGSGLDIPAELDGTRVLTKPIDDTSLSNAVAAILDGA